MAAEFDLIIEADSRESNFWRELWAYRELFYFLAWRDILVRYKQTVIGIAWSVVRPLLTMVVFTIVFGQIAKLPSGDTPYPILVFAAMLPWQFFASALSESSNSLINNSNLLTKVFFPRIIVPISAVMVSIVDFFVSFVILALLLMFYHFTPDWRIFTLPLFIFMAMLASLGAGLWFSAMNVKYRDFRFLVPFLVQLGLYISPVGFSSDVISEKWRLLYSLNPMVGVIDGFRWALLGGKSQFYWPGFFISLVLTIFLFIFGVDNFRNMEKEFSDII